MADSIYCQPQLPCVWLFNLINYVPHPCTTSLSADNLGHYQFIQILAGVRPLQEALENSFRLKPKVLVESDRTLVVADNKELQSFDTIFLKPVDHFQHDAPPQSLASEIRMHGEASEIGNMADPVLFTGDAIGGYNPAPGFIHIQIIGFEHFPEDRTKSLSTHYLERHERVVNPVHVDFVQNLEIC